VPTPVPAPPPAPVEPVAPVAAPTPGTHLRLERLRHDFGVVKQNADLKAAIVMTNVGTTAVHVNARGECACAQATVSKKTLEPGESGTLELNVHTYTFVGKILKHVRVTSDDPEQADVAVEVAADVSAGVLVEPANFFFNSSLVGTSPTATVKVKYHTGVGRPFQVKDVKATGTGVGDVSFEAKPFFEGEWKGYEVTMRFAHPPPVGMVSGEAMIHTDDPDYAALKCLVGGNISGKVFIAQETTSVGIPQQGKEVVLKIGCRGFDDTIDLGEVTAKARKGVVSAKAVRDPTDAKQWTIEITLPGTTPPGTVDDVVEVTTAVKGEEHHEIRVGGTVIAKP
jgi:hypothetical protein